MMTMMMIAVSLSWWLKDGEMCQEDFSAEDIMGLPETRLSGGLFCLLSQRDGQGTMKVIV